MLTAGIVPAEHCFAVGEVDHGKCLLPAVAKLLMHSGRLEMKSRGIFRVADDLQYVSRTAKRGGLTAWIPDLAFK